MRSTENVILVEAASLLIQFHFNKSSLLLDYVEHESELATGLAAELSGLFQPQGCEAQRRLVKRDTK
jgi:hypothetical protein